MYVYVYHPCLNEIIRRQVRASFRGDGAVFVFPMYDTGPDMPCLCHSRAIVSIFSRDVGA